VQDSLLALVLAGGQAESASPTGRIGLGYFNLIVKHSMTVELSSPHYNLDSSIKPGILPLPKYQNLYLVKRSLKMSRRGVYRHEGALLTSSALPNVT
jgi:hypothetical protein